MRIAFLIPEFPGQTHGFFWREIRHIEKIAGPVDILSTTPSNLYEGHGFFQEAFGRTLYMLDFIKHNKLKSLLILLRCLLAVPMVKRAISASGENERIGRLVKLTFGAGILKEIACRQQIEHVHGHSCADVGYVLAISRLLGGPQFSLSLHGDLAVYGSGHRFKFAQAKFVACVTHALVAQVRTQTGVPAAKLEMVRMGIATFADESSITDQRLGHDAFTLITVSRLNLQKGHRFVIDAIKRLRDEGLDVRYHIVGNGEHLESLRAHVDAVGLQDAVLFLGSWPNEKIVASVSQYHAFILASVGLGEAAPVAVMEAMGQGVAVICSIIGGTPEMIDHEVHGILTPQGDVAAISAAIRSLYESPSLRQRLARAGRQRAGEQFRFDMNAEKLLSRIRGESPAEFSQGTGR